MKPLILSLFIAVMICGAQEKGLSLDDPLGKNWTKSEWGFAPYTGKVDSEFSAYILNIFVKAYSRYEKEAMRDSIPCGEVWAWDSTASVNGYVDVMKRIRVKYIHPNAPPPNPFFDWLKRQR